MTCKKCNDTGFYMYDETHSKVCEVCCPHNCGFWELKEHYGNDNSKLCCSLGCGFVKDKEEICQNM